MIDPTKAGVSEQDWREATSSCESLAVADVVHGREVVNREALANPEALALFTDLPELG